MPVGFNSPARNLFLFGTSGEQVVQNFFKNVDLSGSNDKCFRPSDIRLAANGDYFIAGTSQDNTSADNGFVDRRSFNTETSIETLVSQFGVSSSQVNVSTTLTALEVDSNFKLILCGKTGSVPWVGRFNDTGVADWISTSNTADVEYSGIAFDSNGIYLCGHTPTASGESYAVVEKYDLNGSPIWGKTIRSFGDDAEIERVDVNSKGELIAVGKIADNTKNKGYISKIDTSTGEILWSRTLEHGNKTGSFYDSVFCTDVHIDENDEIFISGNIVRGISVRGFYVKYSAEGNMILQRENGVDQYSTTTDIYSDGLTGQTTVAGTYITTGGDYRATISKYSRQGVLLWRRYYRTDNGGGEVRLPNFHAEGAFYYVAFNDDVFDSNNLTPNSYLYGKVSSSGNGLGGFVYDAQDSKFIDYEITTDISNEIGKLSDGSVRNDTSDFISYPYSGNRIAFDDLATVVANKKVQVDDVGIYEESGSPAIRPADFQELNVLGENNFVGPELIINGTFDTDTNGWSSGNGAILTVESNALKIANNGTQISGFATQAITTVPGEQYTVAFEVVDDTSSATWLRVGNNFGWVDIVNQNNNVVGTYETTFTAEGTVTYITFMVTVGIATRHTIVDNISVKQYKSLDTSGKGNDGGVNGATHNAAGWWEFDGTDDKISMNPILPAGTTQYTIEAWFRHTGANDIGGPQVIWEQNLSTQTTSRRACMLLTNHSGVLGFNGQSNDFHSGPSAASIVNTWHHSVITVDTSDGTNPIKIYANGSLFSEGQTSGPGAPASNLNMGAEVCGLGDKLAGSLAEEFKGDIGEVRIYPRVLTAAQVFQNYNATKSKYINEAPDTAPKVGPDIVYGSNLLLNYDFGNRATYDSAENLLESSEDFSSTYWVIQNCNVTDAPDQISPGGTKNVKKLAVNDGTNLQVRLKNFTSYGVGTYTSSIYAKAGEKTGLTLFFDSTDVDPNYSGSGSYYNLLTGQVTSNADAAGMEDVGGGWWRCWATNDTTSSGNTHPLCVVPQGDSYVSVNTQSNNGVDGIYIWGAQVVENDTLSRYIRTFESAITPPTAVTNLSNSYLTAINGATFNSAGYFDFDGTDDYINLTASVAPLADTSAVTMEAWVNVDNLTNTYQCIGTWERTTNHWQLTYSGDTNYNLNLSVSGSNDSAGTTSAPATGSWQHVVATWNGGSLSTLSDWAIYVNGVAQTIQLTGSTGTGGNDSYIGTRQGLDASNMLDGKMGEIRYYNRALTSTEVSQNFNATRAKYGV